MRADPEALLAEAVALVEGRGWQVSDRETAQTGSLYFTALRPEPTPPPETTDTEQVSVPVFLRVRISGHRAAGWQVRARHAFITTHSTRRAARDLARLEARLMALEHDRASGRPSCASRAERAGFPSLRALVLALILAGLALTPGAQAAEIRLDPERFARLDRFVSHEVAEGRLPGAVALVAGRKGILVHKAYGFRVPKTREPMDRNAIFRLYSMTKPITSVGVLMLVEEGRIRLSDPVSDYLPEFAAPTVWTPAAPPWDNAPIEQTRGPAPRAPSIWDLLRHASGLTYGQGGPNDRRAQIDAGVLPEDWSRILERDPLDDLTLAQASRRIASLPLAFKPGTRWAYGRSTDVLGRLIEVVSGQSLGVFLSERLFEPLAMADTGFRLTADQIPRLVMSPANMPDGTEVRLFDATAPRRFESGGGGLLGTASDYGRFCQMLLNGGTLDRVRLLSPKSVAMMTTDQIGALGDSPAFTLGSSYGFGLGVFVRSSLGPSPVYGGRGEYGWWGAGGTAFWADPEAGLCGVWMTQQPDESRYYSRTFRALVYQAIKAPRGETGIR